MKSSLEKEKLNLRESIRLDSGKLIDSCEVAFKTYGKLNKYKSNAILVCHALSGDQFCSGTNPQTRKNTSYFPPFWSSRELVVIPVIT